METHGQSVTEGGGPQAAVLEIDISAWILK